MAKIRIELLVDEADLVRGFDKAGYSAKRFDRVLEKSSRNAIVSSRAYKGLGKQVAITAASFFGARGLAEGIRESINAAGDMDRQLARTRTVFRGASGEVLAFSKTSATALGLSREEALKTTDTFGSMLKGMGSTTRGAERMSTTLTKVGVDLAALHNVDPSAVFTALQAGIAGRTRGLKTYGIFIDQAAIKEEALRLGLVKSTKNVALVTDAQLRLNVATFTYSQAVRKHGANSVQAARALLRVHSGQRLVNKEVAGSTGTLSNAARAAAVYSLIVKGAASAHGAFGRSSKDIVIQQRILHAELRDQEELLGRQLTPELLNITTATNKWLSSSANQARVQHDLHQIVSAGVTTFKIARTVIGGVDRATGGLNHTIELLLGLKVASGAANMARSLGLIGRSAKVAATTTKVSAVGMNSAWRLAGATTAEAAAGIAATGRTAEVAASRVGLLRRSLLALTRIGLITIPIEILINRKTIETHVDQFLKGHGLGALTGENLTLPPGTTRGQAYGLADQFDSAGNSLAAKVLRKVAGGLPPDAQTRANTNEQNPRLPRGTRSVAPLTRNTRTVPTTPTGGGLTGGGGGGGNAVDTVMARLQILLTRAQQTPGLRDDLRILNLERQHLEQRLRVSKGNLDLQQQLADVEGQIGSVISQEQDRLRGLVGGLFQGPVLAPSEEDIKRRLGVTGPSVGKLTSDLAAQNARFAAENRDITRLRRRGASDRLLTELQDIGPAGAAQVHTLATASDKALKAFFGQFSKREKLVANAVRVEMSANVVNVRAGRISQAGDQARRAQATRERNRSNDHSVVQHNQITIVDSRDSNRAARQTASHLQRQAKSTTVQRRGRNPGVSGAQF